MLSTRRRTSGVGVARIEFQGRIGNDWRDSEPWWPPLPTPPEGAPNVVLVVLDDVGFAQLGCYGSDIETPAIDGVAAEGVRLTNFHTTALCSPTRACLLTGRNHHRSGMGRVADLATGFPGYWGRPPRENGFLSEMLRATGYATYAVGKWHLSPEGETNMAQLPGHLAARPRLRPLVRLPRRRDPPVRAGALPRQPRGAPAALGRRRLPPERRPGRPGHRVPGRPARRRRRTAVLLVLRHGRVPLAPPRTGRVDRALQGALRQGLGRLAPGDVRPPARRGHRPRGHRAHAAAAVGPELGQPRRARAHPRRALHGVLRRVLVLHGRADRPGARLHR